LQLWSCVNDNSSVYYDVIGTECIRSVICASFCFPLLEKEQDMKMTTFWRAAVTSAVVLCGVQGAYAEKLLKLGTTGRLGMPIGDAIDQALIPAIEKASGGKMKIVAHYQKSLCAEQKCGEQANQGLLALWTSSTANFGRFGTELEILELPFIL